MKIPSLLPSPASRRNAARAFSLPEIMIVSALLTLLVAATVSAQIFGLQMYRVSETKLTTTADARASLNRIRDEIRSARLLYVGNGDSVSFRLITEGQPHVGNALKICSTTDTNSYVYYYMDRTDSSLNRMVSGSPFVEIIAENVTNHVVFRAEDFQGNVVGDYENNRVIHMLLQFHQRQFSAGPTASHDMYENYQLQTRIAQRADNRSE